MEVFVSWVQHSQWNRKQRRESVEMEGRGYRLEDRGGLTSRRTEEGRRIPWAASTMAHVQFTVMKSK